MASGRLKEGVEGGRERGGKKVKGRRRKRQEDALISINGPATAAAAAEAAAAAARAKRINTVNVGRPDQVTI